VLYAPFMVISGASGWDWKIKTFVHTHTLYTIYIGPRFFLWTLLDLWLSSQVPASSGWEDRRGHRHQWQHFISVNRRAVFGQAENWEQYGKLRKLLKVNPQYLVQAFILVRIVDVGNENSKLFDTWYIEWTVHFDCYFHSIIRFISYQEAHYNLYLW